MCEATTEVPFESTPTSFPKGYLRWTLLPIVLTDSVCGAEYATVSD